MTAPMYNVDVALCELLYKVLEDGHESSPRGKKVKEIIGSSITFDMRRPLVTLRDRKLGYRFAPAEAAWILSGDNRLDTIRQYSKFIWEFSDDGIFYNGAYGPRVIDQLTYVCDALIADNDTRQAVIEVWRPSPRTSRDIPCTLSFQFLLRDGRLNCVQSMRSSDTWLGYPYDAFNASMLTGYVMLILRKRGLMCEIGNHTMLVASQHLYEREWQLAHEMISRTLGDDKRFFIYRPFNPYEFESPQHLIDHLWSLAAQAWHAIAPGTFLRDELEEYDRRSRAIDITNMNDPEPVLIPGEFPPI